MDPRLKTALAVAIGVVIGMTLLGTAIAVPAAFHAMAFRASAADERGFGMMGQQGMMDRQGMMGDRDRGPRWDEGSAVCPNGGEFNAQGGCSGSGRGMGGQGRRGQLDNGGACPNGVDPSACPGYLESPTTES